jgi:uncharacterized protein involved in outer membrane biogenesis
MRWLKIIIITLGGLLAACVLLLVSILLFVGYSDLSGVITRAVNTFTDHYIEIDGPVTLELSTAPMLNAAGVRFRMQDESVELQADDLRLQLDIPSLADNHLLIREFGTHNTTVTVRLQADRTRDKEGELDIELGAVTFNRVDIENLAVDVYQPHEIEPLHLKLDVLQAQRNELGVMSPITARGSVDGEPFALDGSVARGEADTAADRSYIVDLHAEVLQSSLRASGELAGDGGAAPTGDLSVQLEIPDVQAVLQLFHIGMPALGSLTASGHLAGTPAALQLDGLEATLAREGVNLTVQGGVASLNSGAGVDLSYVVDITDATLLAWLLPDQLPQFHTVRAEGSIAGDPGQLSVELERLEALDGRGHALDARGKSLVLEDAPYVDGLQVAVNASVPNLDYVRQFSEAVPKLGPVKATANVSMNDGVLAIHDIKATSTAGSKGRVHAEGSIGHISFTPVDVSQMDFSARVENVTTKQIAEAVDIELPAISPVSAHAKYSGSDKKSAVSGLKLQAGHRGKLLLDVSGDIHIGDMSGDRPLTSVTLDVALHAPNSAELGSLTGGKVPALGFFKGNAKIREINGLIGIAELEASIKRGNDFNVQLSGTMDDLINVSGINMRLDMNAADLQAIGQPFEVELPREGSVRMAGNLRGNREQVSLRGRTNLRNTTMALDLTGSFNAERPRIVGSIDVPVLDVNDVGLHPERHVRDATATDTQPATATNDEAPKQTVPLFSQETIDLSGLHKADLDIRLSINDVSSTAASLDNLFIHVKLNDGLLEIKPARLSIDNDEITTNLILNAKPKIPTAALTVEGKDIDLGLLLKTTPENPAYMRGIMTTKTDLHSQGRSRAELAANLSGSIKILTENARVRRSDLDLINLNVFGWVVSNVVSLKKDVDIGCAIFSVKFDNGIGETEMFLVDTPDTLIRVDADVDFRDETMYVAILPERKIKLLGSRKPMEIKGPITNPEYEVVSLKNLTVESSRAALLAPLTITGTVLENIAFILGVEDEPQGTCDQFISR